MVKRPDELHDPIVVPIDDEFNRLSPDEQVKATDEWRRSLDHGEPIDLPISTADLLALDRAEAGG